MSTQAYQFVLIYGNDLQSKFISEIVNELNKLPHQDPTILVHANNIDKEKCNGCVVVLVAHSSINIDDTGKVSYISSDEMNIETIEYLRDNTAAFWFAGCDSANADVTYADTEYKSDPYHVPHVIHPFASQGYSQYTKPIISTYWLLAFLQVTRYNSINWWKYTGNFFLKLQENNNRATQLLKNVHTKYTTLRANKDKLDFDDTILYPYRISFPEVVHMAVFRTVYPHKEFIVVDSPRELLYRRDLKDKLRLSLIGKDGNENWLSKIHGNALLPEYPTDVKELIRCFNHGHGGKLSNYFVDYLRQQDAAQVVNIRAEVRRRLMLTGTEKPIVVRPRIAIVCRISRHSKGDMRMKVTSTMFKDTVWRVCDAAVSKGWGIVVMDGESPEILDIVRRIDANYQNLTNHTVDNNGDKRNTVEQMQHLQREVQKYNIKAAVGIHGGFLDVLTILGVSPENTIRMCSNVPYKFKEDKWSNWKRRTENLHILFHNAKDCIWLPTRVPTETEINKLFECN